MSASGASALFVQVQSRACAIPVSFVIETMRPLPIEKLRGIPPFVLGASMIRGAITPVVDLGALIGAESTAEVTRFVTLRVGERQVALAVDRVLGVGELADTMVRELPPMLEGIRGHFIEAISTLDEKLLMVLKAGRMIPEGAWEAFTTRDAAP